MSQIKILVKLSYLSLSNMKKSELNLILNEEEFNKMLLEIEGLQKGLWYSIYFGLIIIIFNLNLIIKL